jgi:hypothetical protein
VESNTGFYGDKTDQLLAHIPNRLSFRDNLSRPQLGLVLNQSIKLAYVDVFRNALASETISWHKDAGTANPVLSMKNIMVRYRTQLMALQKINDSGKITASCLISSAAISRLL